MANTMFPKPREMAASYADSEEIHIRRKYTFRFCFWNLVATLLFTPDLVELRLVPAGAGYVGAGYNLLLGNNDGSHFTSGGPDPGLMSTKIILQKSLIFSNGYCPTEAICTETADDTTDDQFSLIADLQQYQRLYSSAWEFETQLGDAPFPVESKFAGSASSPISEASDIIEAGKSIILDQKRLRTMAEIRYNYKENRRLTTEFALNLCDLPMDYTSKNYQAYRRFITAWGTHIIVAVRIGEAERVRYEIPFSILNNLLAIDPQFTSLLEVNSTMSIAAYRSTQFQKPEVIKAFTDLVKKENSTFRTWKFSAGSPTVPSPVHLTLRRLDYFITQDFVESSMVELCSNLKTTKAVAKIQSNLRRAVFEYPINSTARSFTQLTRRFRLEWPRGSYAIIKNKNCPDGVGNEIWYGPGKRVLIDLLSMFIESLPTSEFDVDLIDIRGWGTLTLKFCVKLADTASGLVEWPMGSYCIFRKTRCPVGFSNGSITIPSVRARSENDALPDGKYTIVSTAFEFCCRNDRPVDSPIVLPPSQPFTLLSVGGQCQKVVGMEAGVRIQSIRKGKTSGSSPFVATSDKNVMRLFFCYYKSRT